MARATTISLALFGALRTAQPADEVERWNRTAIDAFAAEEMLPLPESNALSKRSASNGFLS